jgi:hypothetical protein
VSAAGGALGRAGGEFDSAWAHSENAASRLGGAFVNDGAAVYDRGTHLRNMPAGFGEAASRLTGASRRLTAVAEDLSAAMRETSAAVSGLHTELSRQRSEWAARVAAAGTGPGGLIPENAVAGLLGERDRVAAAMTSRVGQVGRSVSQRIHGYEVVVNDALRLLADQGFVPVEDLDRPAPAAPRLEGGVDPTGFGTPLTAGYAADPVNTALGNFVEVETDLLFTDRSGLAGRAGRRRGCGSGRGRPSSRARTGSRSASRAPARPSSGARSGSTLWWSRPALSRVRGGRWRGSTGAAGSSIRPVGSGGPGPAPVPAWRSVTTRAAGWSS